MIVTAVECGRVIVVNMGTSLHPPRPMSIPRSKKSTNLSPMDRAQVVLDRIAELATLQDGWLYGDGLAISEESRTRAAWVLSWLLSSCPQLPAPGVYPTPEGGVQAEWVLNDVLAEVVFQGEAFTGVAVVVSTSEECQFPGGTVGELQEWVSEQLALRG